MHFMLKISKLSCERDDRILFADLDYSFPSGTLTQLEGANGSGKTTLLRILAGLYASYAGDVLWKDEPLASRMLEFKSQLLFIGHKSAVKPELSALENLKFLIGLQQSFKKNDLYAALDSVGLSGYEDVLCRNLSAGQQRRVALARFYLSRAKLWILDEVFTAIDLQGVAQLESLFVERAKSGVTIIFTTHHKLTVPALRVLRLGRNNRCE